MSPESRKDEEESNEGDEKSFITQPKNQIVYTEKEETGFIVAYKDWRRVKRKVNDVKDRSLGNKGVESGSFSISAAAFIELVFGFLRGEKSPTYFIVLIVIIIGGLVVGQLSKVQNEKDKDRFNSCVDDIKKEMEDIEK